MKKNSDTPTLEQLLASVEHAGRDSRRRQQLSAMIEQMAADEADKRRQSRLWTARLAAAATVTLFVSTAVWQWTRPAAIVGPQLAQAPVVRPTVLHVPQPVAPAPVAPAPVAPAPVAATPAPTPTADYVLQPLPAMGVANTSAPIVAEPEEALPHHSDYDHLAMAENEEPQATDTQTPSTPAAEPVQMAQTATNANPQPRRNSFFSLFQAEPSMMDGTTLAFNIL